MAELRRYLEFYRKYVLVAGDLIIRRKARLQGVSRVIRNTQAQVQMCQESLDPNRQMYKDELKALMMQKDEIKANLEELQEKFLDQKKDFTPTEDLLEELGEEFIPPQIEHDEMETGKRAEHLGVTKKLVADEQDEVDMEQTAVRKIGAQVRMGK